MQQTAQHETESPRRPPLRQPIGRQPILLSRSEVATALCLGQRTVDELIAQGTLPSIRIGRRVLVRQDVLDQFVQARRVVLRKHAKGAA
jgi:excisionase family DNA binding protein